MGYIKKLPSTLSSKYNKEKQKRKRKIHYSTYLKIDKNLFGK
jgi:hypothetical protein